MALELSGEGRPLLGSPSSPVDGAGASSHLHVRWSCLEALPPEPPPVARSEESEESDSERGLVELAADRLGKPPPPPGYSSMLSTDSGCESEGVSDSVYSTVTSCTSDLMRLQLDSQLSEEQEQEQQQEQTPAQTQTQAEVNAQSTGVDLQQLEPADDYRVRSWSLEARARDPCVADPAASAIEPLESPEPLVPSLPLRQSQSEPSLTTSASTASMPICRICHMPSEERAELISPCRCAGTMQYIHTACLMHWIEVSSRRSKRPPCCELCQYQYQRHKRFRVGRWVVPAVSTRDKVLHSVFVVTAVVMVICAVITVFCFKQDSGKRRLMYDEAELTPNETVTLICGILFFACFFIGMYCEVKAKYSMYHLITRVFYLNQQWYIDEYDRSKDVMFRGSPPGGTAV